MAKFNSTQPEFLQAAQLILSSLLEKILVFAGFKAKYDAAYVAAAQSSVNAAEALPDEEARTAVHQLLRINVEKTCDKGREKFQALKRYIEDAFPPEEHAILFNQAGQAQYEKAAGNDWEANKQLLVSATQFVTDNNAQLMAGNNMPATFLAEITLIKQAVSDTVLQFYNAREGAKVGAQQKITALETEYDHIIQICKDGQHIFREDAATRDQFTFNTVLELIRGAGVAGLRGFATGITDSTPIPNCKVQLLGTTFITFTDADGRYSLKNVPAGTYSVQFTAAGFQQITITMVIKVGTMSGLSVQLVPTV